MSFSFNAIDFTPDPSGWRKLLRDEDGDVAKDLIRRGHAVAFLAAMDAPRDTGALARSIEVTYIPGPVPQVLIGSNLNYAYFVHEGTEPHEILPAPGRMLRFKVRGRVVYAQQVNHPGTRANPFLERHLRRGVND